jgi:hypothetical protein
MEEEDHFTQTLLPALIAALAAAAMAARLLPLQLSTFSLYSSHSHHSHLILLSHNAFIYRHFMAAAPLVLLSNMAARLGMVGCLTIEEVAANSQWLVPTICCTCNGNNPTMYGKSKSLIIKHFLHEVTELNT